MAVLEGHKDWLISVAFSPDGLHVVTTSDDQTARVWDAGDGHQTADSGGPHGCRSVGDLFDRSTGIVS